MVQWNDGYDKGYKVASGEKDLTITAIQGYWDRDAAEMRRFRDETIEMRQQINALEATVRSLSSQGKTGQ
jgi:hypothetical protein